MSWSYKIIFAYVVFIVGIMSMVFIASQQTNEMQEDNYYAKELVYQKTIDGKNNLNKIANKLTIVNSNNSVIVKIPAEVAVNIVDGNIYFLRPSDQSKDIKLMLKVDENSEQKIPTEKLINGLYSIKISWKSNGTPYFYEQNFMIVK